MCGGTIEFNRGDTVGICDSCGTKQTLPRLDDDKKVNLYDRANHFRRNNDYDKAMGIYEQILNADSTDAEAYWSLVLCRYGVEYVEDPATHKRVPTVNRAQFTSIFDDDNYKSALKYADFGQKAIYEEEANTINEIQKGILAISQKEEPFDVFICYKETDNNGRRTQDSVLANDLYHQLTQEGFKVFFSRITLEDKLGTAYEPYIFAALNSAKVMVVIGTKAEYFNAVWVKNEWSRYLSLIRNNAKKVLIPAYRDMDPYDLPDEFAHLQAQDMSKLGFMQDLIRGIEKIIGEETPKEVAKENLIVKSDNANIAPLLKRAFMFLEDGEWSNADAYCERVLDLDPENANAYLGKLMTKLRIKKQDQLSNVKDPFDEENAYQKVMRFGDESLKKIVSGYVEHIRARNEIARQEIIYQKAAETMKSDYQKAAELFESIPEYLDATILAERCHKKVRDCCEEKKKVRALLSECKKVCAQESKQKKQFERINVEKEFWKAECQRLQDQQNELKKIEAETKICNENITTMQEELVEYSSKMSLLGIFAKKERKELKHKMEEISKKMDSFQKKIAGYEKRRGAISTERELEIALIDAQKKLCEAEEEEKREEMLIQSVKTRKEILRELEQYGASESLLSLYQAKEGDCIKFGTYWQAIEPDAEKKAIEWKVLAKEGEKLLLISKRGLDCKPYNTEDENVTWEISSIRKWLNAEFMQEVFNTVEKELITEIKVKNTDNKKYKTKGGKDTQDKIFLLSIEEAEKFFTSDKARACVPTGVCQVKCVSFLDFLNGGRFDRRFYVNFP